MDVSLSVCDLKTECLCMHAGKIYMIDYEYGSHNYRSYDIANHFNEHVGFECEYSLYVSPSLILFLCICVCVVGFHFAFSFWLVSSCNLLCCSCIVSSHNWASRADVLYSFCRD